MLLVLLVTALLLVLTMALVARGRRRSGHDQEGRTAIARHIETEYWLATAGDILAIDMLPSHPRTDI